MYDQERADWAVKFVRRLKHTKGTWAGKSFNLQPWQEKIIRDLFGTVNEKGARQYRTAYIEIPRKNGKSELGAAIALLLLFGDGEQGAEIYSAAADRDQAAIVYNVAAQMVRQDEALMRRAKVIDSTHRILFGKTNSIYRVLSSEVAGKHGYNAHGIVFDELHTQPNRELWDVLTTSGGTRAQPLVVAITTAGFDRNSICWEQHDYAEKLLRGIIKDPTFYPVIYSAPEDADWADEKVWEACNPGLDSFRDIEEMRALCAKAQQTPALENTFRRLYLCQWTQQDKRWMPIDAWDATAGAVDAAALKGQPCYAGLDLASESDLAAFVLVFPDGAGSYSVLCRFWIPADNIEGRVRKHRVPYVAWRDAGLVRATPGNIIDQDFILREIIELSQEYDIRELAYDRWGAAGLIPRLQGEGLTVVPFGQGFASMAGPTKELMALVLAKKLIHGGDPVLRWMANNMVVRQDAAGNLKPDKAKSTEKIDGMVALVMGLDRAMRHNEQRSVYEERGALVV